MAWKWERGDQLLFVVGQKSGSQTQIFRDINRGSPHQDPWVMLEGKWAQSERKH